MNQQMFNQALNNIRSRKQQALRRYEEELQALYQDEEYLKAEENYKKVMIENARCEAYGETPDKLTEEKCLKLMQQMKKKHHLEDVEIHYHCKLCQDEGMIDGERCVCLNQEISRLLLKESGFDNLESFAESIKTCGDLVEIYHLMQKWCQSDFKKNLVYIAGPTGVGKTHLIKCMANELIERGKVVKLVTAFSMNQDFKEFSKHFNEEILKKYTDVEVLFVDDLGTEPLYRNVTLEFLYLVINERKMRGLPTIITSNLDMNDFRVRYEERITSRVADRNTSITIFLDGDDKRFQ